MDSKARCVRDVVEPRLTLEGAGVRLQRTIGMHAHGYLDPFLLLDHFASGDPQDYLPDFPWRPHRGIETVTYMLAGEAEHRDSVGDRGTIGPGDVQWMTAGGGVLHEEMPRPRAVRMAGFQLSVNLAAAHEMVRPRYQEVRAEEIPAARRDDGTLTVYADDAPVRSLLAAGRPFDVPIARYGPFVMTTSEEIRTALGDLRADTFVWRDGPEWARRGQTWRG